MGGMGVTLRAAVGVPEPRGRPIYVSRLTELLEEVRAGVTGVDAALARLRILPYQDLGFAKVDQHRALRKGFPEVIYGYGKSPEQLVAIAQSLLAQEVPVLITRAEATAYTLVHQHIPDAVYHGVARAIVVDRRGERRLRPGVLVVTAGTADLPVAEEAALTAELMGSQADRLYDVGVAGVHRLLDHGERLQRARVIVAVAGMEGALPSVLGGLVAVPVIGVPSSVGYGAHLGGFAPLLTMLNTCAPGVCVVNIDNGFGAGYLAALINGSVPD